MATVRIDGRFIEPSPVNPHWIKTTNTIKNDLVDLFYEPIGKLETSDIQLRLCKNKQSGAYCILVKTPDQNEWAVLETDGYLNRRVSRFWTLVNAIRNGKRLTIIDNK